MQEISGSLSEVIRAYSDHNLLVPAATDVQLNPFYKYHVEEVAVDLSENSGDIFKVGSVKTGKTDSKGNDIWQDTYSLSKPLLNKLAMAAGIQFNPHQTCGTHPWPARQYMETEQQGWKEVYDIDKTIVENAVQHFDGAREFLKAIK